MLHSNFLLFSKCYFSVPGSQPDPTLCVVVTSPLGCDRSQASQYLMTLTVLRDNSQVLCRISLKWELSDVMIMINYGYEIWEGRQREPFHYIIRRVHTINILLLILFFITWLREFCQIQ